MQQDNGQAGVSVAKVVKVASNWQKYVIYALLAVCVGLSFYVVIQKSTISALNTVIATRDGEIKSVKFARDLAISNESACKINIENQNTKIREFGDRFNQITKDFKSLEQQIKNGDFYKPADVVRNKNTPKTCQDTLNFINENTR